MRLEHLLSGELETDVRQKRQDKDASLKSKILVLKSTQEQPWYGPLSILFILNCIVKKELQASSYKLQAYDRVSRSEQ